MRCRDEFVTNRTLRGELRVWSLFFAVALGQALGCGPGPTAGGPAAGRERVFDAGVVLVEAGGEAELRHTFTVRNPSPAAAMRLRVAGKSCGCLTTEAETAPVPPGGETTVTVSAPLEGTSGETRQVVRYATGLPDPAAVEFVVKAVRRVRVGFDHPGGLAVSLAPGEVREIGVTVETNRPAGTPPAPVTLSVDPRHVQVLRHYVIAEGEVPGTADGALRSVKTHFVLAVAAPDGPVEADPRPLEVPLVARHAAAAARGVLTISTAAAVRVAPPRVVFRGAAEDAAGREVTLTAERPFRILAADGEGIATIQIIGPGGERATVHRLRLTPHAADAPTLVRRGGVTIRTDHPAAQRVRLSVSVLDSNASPAGR